MRSRTLDEARSWWGLTREARFSTLISYGFRHDDAERYADEENFDDLPESVQRDFARGAPWYG